MEMCRLYFSLGYIFYALLFPSIIGIFIVLGCIHLLQRLVDVEIPYCSENSSKNVPVNHWGKGDSMSRFWSEMIKILEPYVPGEQTQMEKIVKLNTNENPYGPSPKAIEAITAATNSDLRKYPDPNGIQFLQAVANYYGINEKQVFVGNGSDEVLAHIFAAFFVGKAPILFPDVTYSFYPVYAKLYGVSFRAIPLDAKYKINVADYTGDNGGIIFPNPNAPTGIFLDVSHIEQLLAANPDSVVVIDEAYVDFGAQSCVSLLKKYPNLLVVQTLSKSRCLAGLRVGFAMGSAELIEGLRRVKDSFNSYPVDRLALAGAVASLSDDKYFKETTEQIVYNRKMLSQGLQKLGFSVLDSKANFVFATHKKDAIWIQEQLRERTILVRHFATPRTEQYLRITVGTYKEMKILLAAMEEILN